MKAHFAVALCLTTSLISGCATHLAIQQSRKPPDLTVLDEPGAAPERVKRELGEPVRRTHNVATYRYFMPSRRTSPWLIPAVPFLELYSLGTLSIEARKQWKAGRRETSVVYSPNGKVVAYWHEPAARPGDEMFREWLDGGQREDGFNQLADSARRGHAAAQYTMALSYRYGLWGVEPDPVLAYKWALLAAFGGHGAAEEARLAWQTSLSAQDLGRAQRMFSAWPSGHLGAP